MGVCKVPELLLKRAVTTLRSKTDALRAKLLVLASLRRRMAMVGALSRRIHALVSSGRERQARLEYGDRALALMKHKAATSREREPGVVGACDDAMVDLSEVAMFDEDDEHSYPDWTHSLFDEDNGYNEDGEFSPDDDDDDGVLDDALDGPSVIDIIRSNREVEGLEFNMDEEIDEACDMFIRRFRKRMNRSF